MLGFRQLRPANQANVVLPMIFFTRSVLCSAAGPITGRGGCFVVPNSNQTRFWSFDPTAASDAPTAVPMESLIFPDR